LIEGCRRAAIEMHTTVPQAVAAQRITAADGIGQRGQLLQRIAFVAKRMTPVLDGGQWVGNRLDGCDGARLEHVGRRQNRRRLRFGVEESGQQVGHGVIRSCDDGESVEKVLSPGLRYQLP
jgi:hypothetical protein